MTERRKNQSEEWTYFTLLFINFITVNKYRFCISVIGYINVQIIGISTKKSVSVNHYLIAHICHAGLFTSIFDESLATSVVPTSFKKTVIAPVPKNNNPSCLNDYRPVALTSTVMKVFERLLKKHICSSIPATLGSLQLFIAQIDLLTMPSLTSFTLPSHTLTAKMTTL